MRGFEAGPFWADAEARSVGGDSLRPVGHIGVEECNVMAFGKLGEYGLVGVKTCVMVAVKVVGHGCLVENTVVLVHSEIANWISYIIVVLLLFVLRSCKTVALCLGHDVIQKPSSLGYVVVLARKSSRTRAKNRNTRSRPAVR